jgi:hypothetical protein
VKPKTIKTIYWVLTVLFVLAMLMDGGAGIAKEKTGQEVMKHLGYPIYIMVITGIAKIFGAIAILQNRYKTIKEWAFAGFTINFIGAFASRAFVGDEIGLLIPPLVMLGVMFLLYYFWKQPETIKTI